MKLTVVWHKVFWPSSESPTGFAAHGGLVRQIETLSEIFDETCIVGPCSGSGDRPGERAVAGKNVSVTALTCVPRSPWLTWAILPFWLVRNGLTLTREISRADAVCPLLPSPIGTLGLFLALALRKPVLVRPMNNWSEPRLLWRLERALLEKIAGGRNVVFATGDSDEPPSRNPAIRWIFSTTVSEAELGASTTPRSLTPGRARLIIVGRQLETEGSRIVLAALPRLAHAFPGITLDVIGDGPDRSRLRRFADELQLADRVTFHGAANHERVLELLRQADLFCLPTAETESVRQAVTEALACGLPVVTTRTSIAPMLMAKGCGMVLLERTPEAFAAAVRACLSDPAHYRSMSTQALRTARGHSIERWREMIRSALEEAWGPLQSKPTGARV
jgi:glycosyltransferase involved in cell wall biosynthesis